MTISIEQLAPYLSGPIAGLVVALWWNWNQTKEKAALQATIKAKDEDLKGLTRESIAGITTLAGLNQQNQEWQKATTATLASIKDALP